VTTDSVSVVVPTRGRPDTLVQLLDSVIAAEHPSERLQLIVVDDSGGDSRTAQVVRARESARVAPVLVSQDNRGAAAARNRGARMAEGDILLFCDDDIVVGRDHLRLHLDSQEEYPGALVNGVSQFGPSTLTRLASTPFGRYRIKLEAEFETEADGRPLSGGRVETRFVSARNLSLRRDLFWEVGGFDEAFPFAGAEDQDLSIRARIRGSVLIRDHRIRVVNNESIVTFPQFCRREERSAQTMVVLARKRPAEAAGRPIITRNGPIARPDPASLIAAKLLKSAASRPVPLRAIHAMASWLERLNVPDRTLWPCYRRILALHVFRGVRTALRNVPEP
jgi:GT2 family glycosyltransferase